MTEKLTIGSIAQLTTEPMLPALGGEGAMWMAGEPAREIARMKAEVEALRMDAERYRYLRDNDRQHFWPPVHGSLWVVQYHQPPGQRVMPETRGAGYREDLDATIDAAMSIGRRSVAVGAA